MSVPAGISLHKSPYGFSCFLFNNKTRATGVHNLLKRTFYPNTDILKQLVSDKKKKSTSSKSKGRRIHTLLSAQKRGCRIDRDILVWSKGGNRYKRMHPFSCKLITAFNEWKWKPVEAQGLVGIEQCRVATAFDLLVQNDKQQLILLEIKSDTGHSFESTDEKRIPWFEHPDISSFPNNGLNRALLQVALTARYFHATRGGDQTIHKTYVVKVDDEGVKRYPQCTELVTPAMAVIQKELLKRIR